MVVEGERLGFAMVVKGEASPARVPPVTLQEAAASTSPPASGIPAAERAAGAAAGAAEEAPHTPQVSSKHWRKIRSAVVALAAFRSRRVSGVRVFGIKEHRPQ